MDENVSYNFGLIDSLVRREIHATTARLNASLTDLRSRIAPLRASWTRETATAFGIEQDRWDRAAAGLNDILPRLGHAVGDGADEVAATDRREARRWG